MENSTQFNQDFFRKLAHVCGKDDVELTPELGRDLISELTSVTRMLEVKVESNRKWRIKTEFPADTAEGIQEAINSIEEETTKIDTEASALSQKLQLYRKELDKMTEDEEQADEFGIGLLTDHLLSLQATELNLKERCDAIATERAMLTRKIDVAMEEADRIRAKIEGVRRTTPAEEDISQQLAEIELKRKNVQMALESLRGEEEAKMKRMYSSCEVRKIELTKEVSDLERRIAEMDAMREEVERINGEITYYEELNALERKRAEETPQVHEDVIINRERIGRLAMLLVSEGVSDILISNLAEELKINTSELMITREEDKVIDAGLGSMWDELLKTLAS